jgi:hypothetical protein
VVLDEDGNEVTTNVPMKQLWCMPITPRLKRLFLNQETTKQMRWHKEGDRQDQDPDIMVHPLDGEAWQTLDRFDPEFARDPRVFVLVCRWTYSLLTPIILLRTHVGRFS